MKKLHVLIIAACITAAAVTGCGKKEAAETTAAQTSAAETTEAETAETETEEEEAVTESTTSYSNDIFSISFPSDLFNINDTFMENTIFFEYTGDSAHPVYLQIGYIEEDPETLAEELRKTEGAVIMVDEKTKPSFWPEEVPLIQQSAEEDGYTSYTTAYLIPYADGTMEVAAVTYKEDDEGLSMAISDDMEALINTLQFNTGSGDDNASGSTVSADHDAFSLTYPEGLFEEEYGEDGAMYYSYTGDADHPVYLSINYYDQKPEELEDAVRKVEGRTVMIDDTGKVSFWAEEIACIQQSSDEDGYTAYYTAYFIPYGDGTETVLAVSYDEPDEEKAYAISDSMEALINSIKFKTAE